MPRWDEAARRKQAELIRTWKPWARSTGPRSEQGKAVSSCNRAPSDFFPFNGALIRCDTRAGKKLIEALTKTVVRLKLGQISHQQCWEKVNELLCKNQHLIYGSYAKHVEK
jgi:hypothetical protein